MIRIPPDPDGQDAAANGMPSPSDCYPAGPVGLCVAGGPVGPDEYLPTLESGWTGKDGSPSPTLGTIIKILW